MTNQTAPYAIRKLNFTFQLGEGSFGSTGTNQLKLIDLRSSVSIEVAQSPTTGPANIRIFGMTLDHMNQLSLAGLVYSGRKNYILIEAGDDISGMTVVYNGQFLEAYPDMNMPDTSFVVFGQPGGIIQLKPVSPSSFSGATSASTILSQMAKTAGLTLENNGVNTILQSPYFSGTIWNQILSCVRAADCFAFLDTIKNVLAIWTKSGSRSGSAISISPSTGMIGYPSFQAKQIIVRVLFNPNLFVGMGPGHQVRVQSQLLAANGLFTINGVHHNLESQTIDGVWESIIIATPVG